MGRQIEEGVEIDSSKAVIIMNSKGEWNGSKLPKIVMETGEDIEEDTFSSGKRMMNWQEVRSKNMWIVERKRKRRERENEEIEVNENPEKKRKVETEVEKQAEVPENEKEEVKEKDKVNRVGKGTIKKGQGTKITNKQKEMTNNVVTKYFLVVDRAAGEQEDITGQENQEESRRSSGGARDKGSQGKRHLED